eukprot:TRINITY_DN4323_c0_g1_i4.p1 TRINITY_DN4323_c0_g1~~TRINITY_DN4323_c0_g1_i4.p1  ORF type:complete len:156 (+),score=22.94 TRINITY_DN4323_c0_g1_i4:1923-2390(+)
MGSNLQVIDVYLYPILLLTIGNSVTAIKNKNCHFISAELQKEPLTRTLFSVEVLSPNSRKPLLQSENEASSGVASLHATLLTFQNQIYALQSSWALSGLGHDYGVDAQTIKEAAVLHYNGKMKPWLDLGISKYKGFWKKFLKRDDQFMDECNVNP